MTNLSNYKTITIFLMAIAFSYNLKAGTRIAILDFELNDITTLPNTPEELARTAAFKPMLEQILIEADHYEIIHIDKNEQQAANPGRGYLFRYYDVAAALGKKFAADWIIVGQHSKPSFLFSYLKARVIYVGTSNLIAEYDIELKGNHAKVTERAVLRLSKDIHALISTRANHAAKK